MPKQKYHQTDVESIFWYETKKGKRFYVRINYKDVRGERKEKTASGLVNITQAKKKKTELQHIIDSGNASKFVSDKDTFGMWRLKYYNSKIKAKKWTKDTIVSVDSIYKNHLSRFDNLTLKQINVKSNYEDFIAELLYEKDLSLKYVKLIHGQMMAIMNYAEDDEAITRNRLRRVEIEKMEDEKKKHLETDELEIVDKNAKEMLPPLKYGMYVLLRMGWRRGEVLGFKLGSAKIINQNTVDVLVNNSRTNNVYEATPKTKKSYRTNRLTGEYANAIIAAIEEARKIYDDHGLQFTNESRIFVNSSTCKTYSPEVPVKFLKKLGSEICHIHPHMMRHTFSSQSRGKGNDVFAVADWLGHTPKVNTETYTHTVKESHLKLVKCAND